VTRYEIQLAIETGIAPAPGPEGPVGERALDDIRRAAVAAPTDPDYHFILGSALAREGRLDQARTEFREACAGSPADAGYRRALGECEWWLGRFDAAADAFRDVLSHAPDDDEARNGLAMSLLRSGQPGPAIEVLRPAVARNPSKRPDWHSNLASALWESGRIVEAEQGYRQAVRLGSGEPAYKRNLGRLLLEQQRPDDAARWLKAAVAQDGRHAPAWISLGDLVLLAAVVRLALVLLPPHVAYYRLHDDVVQVARVSTRDEAVVREGVGAAFARHGLASSGAAASLRITTGEAWRSVEADYSVRVAPLPGLSIPLAFRLRVHEPYFVQPAPDIF